jgi:hypothetical protein
VITHYRTELLIFQADARTIVEAIAQHGRPSGTAFLPGKGTGRTQSKIAQFLSPKRSLGPPAASVVLLRFPAALQFFHSVRPATMPARIVCNSPNRRWASEGGALRDGGRLSPRRDHALGRSRRSVAISGVRSTIIASTCAVLVAPAHDRRPRDETRSTAVPA